MNSKFIDLLKLNNIFCHSRWFCELKCKNCQVSKHLDKFFAYLSRPIEYVSNVYKSIKNDVRCFRTLLHIMLIKKTMTILRI